MRTSDVYLSAALLAFGYKLESIDRKDPRHMVFSFTDKSHNPLHTMRLIDEEGKMVLSENFIEDVETMWANRTLTVNAFDFAEAIKRMKSLIHSGS